MPELKVGQSYTARARREDGSVDVIEFELKGADTSARVISDSFHSGLHAPSPWLSGSLADGTVVTFAASLIASEETSHVGQTVASHAVRLVPHLVCSGPRTVGPTDRFRRLAVQLSDMTDVFYDFDAFKHAFNPKEVMPAIVKAWEVRVGRPLQIGDDPQVAFFTGRLELMRIATALGEIFVRRLLRMGSGGTTRIELGGELYLVIDFLEPLTLLETFSPLTAVMRFLEIIAGRRQLVLDLNLLSAESSDEEPERPISVYWPYEPGRVLTNDEKVSPRDLPMNGGIEPETFAAVMARWLEMDSARLDARVRFSGNFTKGRYDIDRLVGAANMFDILPEEALPPRLSLLPELEGARSQAKAIFKALPPSLERDGVLRSLGLMGALSLPRKILHRASLLPPTMGIAFPDLDIVLSETVKCRNHFVHGSPASLDYSTGEGRSLLAFYTDLLEFVFAASELIEAGWDPTDWLQRGTSMTHPFGFLRIAYRENLPVFRRLMKPTG